jgi:ribulose-phosphate 3-epimerase
MIEIIPAILPLDFEELREKIAIVAGSVSLVQIDVCDGIFVPRKSWPYVSHNPDGDFQNILLEKQGFPFWDKAGFEVDLMVSKPEEKVDDWIAAGAARLIVHIESTDNLSRIIDDFRNRFPLSSESLASVEIGVAIGIGTDLSRLTPYLDIIDYVQCMGISQIGYQGQPFDNRVINIVAELRERSPETIISVDGGVNAETAPRLLAAGANRLVVGSAIFESTNPLETIKTFQNLRV